MSLADVADLGFENCSEGISLFRTATGNVEVICDLPMFSLVSGIKAQMMMM